MNAKIRKTWENSCGWLVKVMGLRMDAAMKTELDEHHLDLKCFAIHMAVCSESGLSILERLPEDRDHK